MSVKLRSKVCKSVMWTDLSDNGIVFDDCIIGNTYHKEFTLTNKSEIELFWHSDIYTDMKPGHSFITLTGINGEVFEQSPLEAFASRKIRLTLHARMIGEFNFDAEMNNLNDISNSCPISVHCVVRFAPNEETLIFPMGRMLDFGDCCAGMSYEG